MDEFLDRFALTLRGPFFQVERLALGFVQGVGFNAGPPDPEGARAKEAEIAGTLQLFEALVAGNGTVLGSFTIADCCAAPVLFRTRNTGLDLTPYPKLLRLRETVTARDGSPPRVSTAGGPRPLSRSDARVFLGCLEHAAGRVGALLGRRVGRLGACRVGRRAAACAAPMRPTRS